jgi:hypothetical protein
MPILLEFSSRDMHGKPVDVSARHPARVLSGWGPVPEAVTSR